MLSKTFQALILLCGLSLAAPLAADGGGGNGGGGGRTSKLTPFLELIDDKKFDQAIKELDEALADDPEDADLLNLVAYSHRQLKRYEVALNYYQKALAIDPEHRGANEYLGELYLSLGQLEKAMERLAVLDKDCFFGCKEFDMLEAAIEEYRKTNGS